MNRVAVVGAVRTPFGKAGRAYAGLHAADLLAVALSGAVGASGAPAESVDEVIVGCTHQAGEQGLNVARNGWLAAGLPPSAAATTVDTQCGSSQQAVNFAAGIIASGQADVVVAGGVESLTRVPMFSTFDINGGRPWSPRQLEHYDMPHQGVAGERLARKYGISREESDAWGLRSHLRAHRAWEQGRFVDEIVRVERDGAPLLDRDEGIRSDTTIERLSELRPSYEPEGVITAGSASQLSDGAAAVVLASEEVSERRGLEPLLWVRSAVAVGVDPGIMLEGPIEATTALLRRNSLSLDQIDVFEVHEAFAPVNRAWLRVHPVVPERVNPDGGAIGQGHPFGASGGRQIAHVAHTLKSSGGRYALQVMCCGGGIGTGTLLEAA